jgi:hypothetical protein
MAINTGDLLMGLGAAVGGTGPQFIQGLEQREQQLSQRKREELEARQKAMYQDAFAGLQLLSTGDLDGLIALGEDRLQILQTFPDADPSDTQRIVQNARLAKQGDPVALRNLATELTSAASTGLSMGLVKMPETQRPMVVGEGEALVNPMTGEALYTGPGKESERKTAQDQNGVLRYLDTGEPVFPGVQAPDVRPEERNAALNNVRSNVDALNKQMSEVVTSYNKVISLESDMRNKSRAAINAAIMNVARLISPGIVTDRDAAALSGADSSVAAIFSFLNGKGVDTNQLMRIVDPTNPETFDVDALLSVARNVTAAGIPSIQAQMQDEMGVADIYGASEQFRKSYFGNTKLQEQANSILQKVGTQTPSFASEAEAEQAFNDGKIKNGQTIMINGQTVVVQE